MSRRAKRAALVLAVVLSIAAAAPGPQDEASTEHYRVLAEGPLDPVEVGRLLEALHRRLARRYRRAPTGSLAVSIYATRDRWAAALRADGEPIPAKGGGYYSPKTKKAYLYVQPSVHYTRQLILHEATHQFHFLVATRNTAPRASWYTEGVAELHAMHTWDGTTLRGGVVPPISLEDYPGQALDQVAALEADPVGVLGGKVAIERPLAWAIVRYLETKHRKRFAALAAALDRGAAPLDAWRKAFGGPPGRDLGEAVRKAILAEPQPWRSVWTEWRPHGPDAIEGSSKTIALAVLAEDRSELEVEIIPRSDDGAFKAGVVFGFRSDAEFHFVELRADGSCRILKRAAARWETLHRADAPAADGATPTLSLAREGEAVTVTVNGTELGRWTSAGALGVAADACPVRFEVRRR